MKNGAEWIFLNDLRSPNLSVFYIVSITHIAVILQTLKWVIMNNELKVEEHIWEMESGRVTGKNRQAVELNRAINKINIAIHTSYKDILKTDG